MNSYLKLEFRKIKAIQLHYNDKSTINIAKNSMYNFKTKYFEIHLNYV
uniref:Uncharacterized protein n=1 Tax=Physcomitrium patens TaxID=3218 RepID=A0A2K1KIM2_PHYPA|nr:hypothetical protein PHYPA_007309 [Physcomitrium patens]